MDDGEKRRQGEKMNMQKNIQKLSSFLDQRFLKVDFAGFYLTIYKKTFISQLNNSISYKKESMHLKHIIAMSLSLNLFIACNTSKRTVITIPDTVIIENETVATSSPTPAAINILSGMSLMSSAEPKSSVFIIPAEVAVVPGHQQLVAMQSKYQGITKETLRLGYELFNGTCTGCHEQKSIYARTEESWHIIVDDMALLAELNDIEKDAVMKYVLSVKATQNSTKIDE